MTAACDVLRWRMERPIDTTLPTVISAAMGAKGTTGARGGVMTERRAERYAPDGRRVNALSEA